MKKHKRGVNPVLFLRQLSFYDPRYHDPHIVIIGAGGIGSQVAAILPKLGVRRITVFDHDLVAPHNISTTPYMIRDIGKPKVKALERVVAQAGGTLVGIPKMYKGQRLKDVDILISAVDSMDARRLLFKVAQEQNIPFYIDGRIGGEQLRIYAIRPQNRKDRRWYRSTLVPNSRVSELPCTAQQVADIGLTTASLITRAVRQWVAERKYNPEIMVEAQSFDVSTAPAKGRVPKRRKPDVQTIRAETGQEAPQEVSRQRSDKSDLR